MNLRIIGEIVKVFEIELDVDSQDDYDSLRFRVELIKDQENEEKITARIWRKEFFRLQPTFPQENDQPKAEASDELVLIEETFILESPIVTDNWKDTLSLVVKKLKERLGIA